MIREYLDNSYTAYHTVKNSRNFLQNNGFIPYDESVTAKVGGKYYIEKNGSAIIAVKVGNIDDYAFNIALAHTDSPVLHVKGRKLLDSPEGKRINVEVYGGLIRYSFMNIPLKIAGRLFVKTENGIKTVLLESDFTVNIPSLCIHHSPEVNEKATLTVQNDMLPLIGGNESDLYKIIYPDGEVIDGDLYVIPAVKSFYSGADNRFLCSPRIDNLTSCYGILNGIVNSEAKGIAVCCLFDNEEIGSHTKQGAWSDFLASTLKRINSDLGKGGDDYLKALNNGFVLSIDNGHAVHPAHPEKSDPQERVYMGGGIVVKHHTNYCTDGYSSAVIKSIMDKANIPYQDYYNNSDIRCGGTLGLIVSANLQMNAVDIGLGQLAMHASVETVSVKDISYMCDLTKAFYETVLVTKGDNLIIK